MGEEEATKQERRQRRQRKKKEKIPQHGKGLARVYKDAVIKRAQAKPGSVRSARRGRGKEG